MISRGPISGSGSGAAGLGWRVAVLLDDARGVVGFGLAASSVVSVSPSGFGGSSIFAVSAGRGAGVLRPTGRRPLEVRGGVVFGGFAVAGFSVEVTAGVSTGVASGDGSGVGVALATSTGGSGSLIRAPTEDTLFVRRPSRVKPGVFTGVSVSAISGPPTIGSNDPVKESV